MNRNFSAVEMVEQKCERTTADSLGGGGRRLGYHARLIVRNLQRVFFAASIDRRPRTWILFLLLLALTLRLGWCLTRPVDQASIDALPDQREYLDLGRSLLKAGTLAMGDPRFNDVVRAFRMPGYPAFVALCGANVRIIRAAQGVIDASTVLAVVLLARRWLSRRLALLAGILIAVDPLHVYFSGLLLTETLFAAMLTWGMTCLVRGASPWTRAGVKGRLIWLAGVSLLIASIYVRPSAIAFPVTLVFVAILAEVRTPDFVPASRRVPVLAIVAVSTLAALLPWALRNRALLDRTIFTTTNDGFTLYDGLNPDADGSSNQSWVAQLPLLPNLSEVQRSDYLRGLAIDFARARPLRALSLVPAKLARTWSPWPLSIEYASWRNTVISAVHAVPLFLLTLIGACNRRLRRSMRLLLVIPAILITLLAGVSVGSLRYRMPADTSLAVLAAGAFVRRERKMDAYDDVDRTA